MIFEQQRVSFCLPTNRTYNATRKIIQLLHLQISIIFFNLPVERGVAKVDVIADPAFRFIIFSTEIAFKRGILIVDVLVLPQIAPKNECFSC
jgi:hypothetical protein